VFQSSRNADERPGGRPKKYTLIFPVLRSGTLFLLPGLLLWALGCGGGSSSSSPIADPLPPSPLTAAEVNTVVMSAAASVNTPLVIAVADRMGVPLAVFRTTGVASSAPAKCPQVGSEQTGQCGNFGETVGAEDLALALARTAAFFSNDQAPLSSRTVRFISGIHFPPGVEFAPNADLYGIENTNRGCPFNAMYLSGQSLPPAVSLSGVNGSGLGIITGKADTMDDNPNAVNPGGVPLFRNNGGVLELVGGVGVVSLTGSAADSSIAEFAAFSGAFTSPTTNFLPLDLVPAPGVVVIGGISLPFVNQITQPSGTAPGVAAGTYDLGPIAGGLPPEGYLVGPNAATMSNAGLMLTQDDVSTIISQAIATASITRAVIRLPDGMRTKMTIAVADLNGNLLALYRMHDGTIFSTDVAVAKSRNVIWFSSPANVISPGSPAGAIDLPGVLPGTAVTNRTISFGAQPLFPPGIDGSQPGPFFNLYLNDIAHPCTQGSDPNSPQFQNGIVFFPGSLPLYKNGVLAGGLGVSGDGVDEDDYVTYGGAQGFLAPPGITADNVSIPTASGPVRLPYLKFPRNPTD